MELTLHRTDKRNDCTLGALSIEGEPFCHTLEPTWRNIGPGGTGYIIRGNTAIPEGRYPVVVTRSEKLGGEWLPLLLHVPRFKGIRIHAGNTVDDTGGCILVGQRPDGHPDRLVESRVTLKQLVKRLAERPEGEAVWITIC